MSNVLLELAERCEREDPGRELDCEILKAAGHNALYRGDKIGWEWRRENKGFWSRMISPTTSLDAAVTLVPEGWLLITLSDIAGDGLSFCKLANTTSPVKEAISFGAKTRPLDVCAAALRARAALAASK